MSRLRCAIYTRKSTDEGLEQEFNSLDAQRDACEAYIQSQKGEGWSSIPTRYDDGAYSGATMERPALQRLLADTSRKARKPGAFGAVFYGHWFAGKRVVELAVWSEPVSRRIPCYTGKIQGIFQKRAPK